MGYLTDSWNKTEGREAEENEGCPDQGLWAIIPVIAISSGNCDRLFIRYHMPC